MPNPLSSGCFPIASRRIKRDNLYKDLDELHLLNLLSRLAAGYFEAATYFFKEEDLCKGIGNFLADILGEDPRNKGALVLHDIEQHYGLIVRRSQYAFSFSHLTFMEYFTAQYVVGKAGNGSLDILIESHFREDRWLEVFLLTAGCSICVFGKFNLVITATHSEMFLVVVNSRTSGESNKAALLAWKGDERSYA